MKITNIVIAFLFAFALFALQAQAADITLSDVTVTPDKPEGYNPGEEATISFKVTNTNATQTRVVNIKSTDLILTGTTSKIPVTQTVQLTLAANTSAPGQLKLKVPSTIAGTYSATLSATQQGVDTNTDTKNYNLIVKSKTELTVDAQNIIIAPGRTNVQKSIVVKNTGSNTVSLDQNSFSHDINLKDDEDNTITLTFPSSFSISPGETKNLNLVFTVPSDQQSKTYSGTVRIKDSSGVEIGSFVMSIQVKPEICKAGNVGNDIDLDINDPDNGDEFNPGDTIRVRFNVDNLADSDLDVEVEAILYDTVKNDELDSVDDSDSIDEDNDQDFEFDLELDSDLKDSSSRYKIFIKAFEDGKESTNCQEEEIDIDVVREAHQVTMSDLSLIPSSVNCGDTVRASVTATNTGKSNERNLRLKLSSLPLGIESVTDTFRLDEDDDVIRDFSFVVPKDVSSGEYVVDVEPLLSGDTSKTAAALLKVTCAALTEPIGPSQQEIELVEEARSLLAQRQYDQALQVLASAEILRDGEQYASLESQIRNAKASSGTSLTGTQGNLPTSKISSLFGSSKNAAVFWIIGDIVLVVIALYFIRLIFSRRREK